LCVPRKLSKYWRTRTRTRTRANAIYDWNAALRLSSAAALRVIHLSRALGC
jgi:hypothetical protein